jgi:hypothetical protein
MERLYYILHDALQCINCTVILLFIFLDIPDSELSNSSYVRPEANLGASMEQKAGCRKPRRHVKYNLALRDGHRGSHNLPGADGIGPSHGRSDG